MGKIEAMENAKSKNVGKELQMAHLRALGWLPQKLLLVQEFAFNDKVLDELRWLFALFSGTRRLCKKL